MTNTQETNVVVKELISFLKKGNAHATFSDAVKDVPFDDLGKKPHDLPYSIWQLTEHTRIAQNDILEFCSNKNYKEKNWPADYWPKKNAPSNESEWKNSLQQIKDDLDAFIDLLKDDDADIYVPFEHGNGQNLMREALLIVDHTSYHTGEILIIRRLLGNWKKS